MYWNPGNLPKNRILLLFQVLLQKALYNKVTMGTARTSELSSKPLHKGSGRESPSWTIFNYAYRRIWSGNGFWIFETILWWLTGAYVAFKLFDLINFQLDLFIGFVCRYGLPGLTPIIIGIAIYKAQVNVGTGDESLRGVPLTGYQVVGPRFLAVFLTWIQIMAPMAVMFLVHSWGLLKEISYFVDNSFQLLATSNIFITWLESGGLLINSNLLVTNDLIIAVLLLIQAIGWGVLPITWGLIWATIYQRRGGPFIFAYSLYLLVPGLAFTLNSWSHIKLVPDDPLKFWILVTAIVVGNLLLSWVFFQVSCRIWSRRSG
jgi:hypothetical protein